MFLDENGDALPLLTTRELGPWIDATVGELERILRSSGPVSRKRVERIVGEFRDRMNRGGFARLLRHARGPFVVSMVAEACLSAYLAKHCSADLGTDANRREMVREREEKSARTDRANAAILRQAAEILGPGVTKKTEWTRTRTGGFGWMLRPSNPQFEHGPGSLHLYPDAAVDCLSRAADLEERARWTDEQVNALRARPLSPATTLLGGIGYVLKTRTPTISHRWYAIGSALLADFLDERVDAKRVAARIRTARFEGVWGDHGLLVLEPIPAEPAARKKPIRRKKPLDHAPV